MNCIAILIHEQEINWDFYIQVQGALKAIFMDAYVYSHWARVSLSWKVAIFYINYMELLIHFYVVADFSRKPLP